MKYKFYIEKDNLGLDIDIGAARKNLTKKQALELSIEKWEIVLAACKVENIIYDGSAFTCALCIKFRNMLIESECGDCPINQDGHPFCEDTPYFEYAEEAVTQQEHIDAAEAELKYLKELYKKLYE